ncbi:MAG: hypothetical protein E7399_00410 [Ruminococcaceae bacterium]|nr:hypothetical protein [Oscillospiraceae bacterium]
MNYREDKALSKEYKQEYLKGLERLIEKRQTEAEQIRYESTKGIFQNQEKFRQKFKEMLGWPLVDYEDSSLPEVTSTLLSEEETHFVYRMSITFLEEVKMTGLFFKAKAGKQPLVIVQHGGLGTPELISGVYGNTSNYNEMLQRVIKHGVHAFAPQLLLWHEEYQVEFDRMAIDAQLKRVGSSITAIEVYGIKKMLDYFETQEFVSDFGMVGLSYGGFYTLFTSAIDTRIKSAISCSFFNKRDVVPWSDWTWFRSAEQFDDAEIACLVYPRRLCLQMGNQDELFDYQQTQASFQKLETLCNNVGTDWVTLMVFEGKHEFCKDDAPIEQLIKDLK